MKKYVLITCLIVLLAGFIVYQQITGQKNTPVDTSKDNATTSSMSSASSTGLYKDGTYTGDVADAYYGKLQVQAVIQNGAIADVVFLQYPNTAGHTLDLSNQVMPLLKTEAILSQSANVKIISGATQTSSAFKESLGMALALAQ